MLNIVLTLKTLIGTLLLSMKLRMLQIVATTRRSVQGLAKLLADRSDTMIMLSATPHDGRAKSFASLMNMLDPTAIADPEHYTKEDINGLCVRRFKKDVKDQVSGSFLERNIELDRCHASSREENAFNIFADMQLQMDLGKTKSVRQLFKTSLEKSLFSSPTACIKSIDARLSSCVKNIMIMR